VKHAGPRSEFLDVRGIRYHVTHWGDSSAPRLFFMHGRMDCGSTWRYVVDELRADWHVIALDWRGCGRSGWAAAAYPAEDYYADVDVLLGHYEPDEPARIVAHSMGGNIMGMYAGIRPARVAWFVSLEGFGRQATEHFEETAQRYHVWLERLRNAQPARVYPNFAAVAERLIRRYPRLSPERALEVAQMWAAPVEGGVALVCDPRLRVRNAIEYRLPEMQACWRRTTAPVLWVTATESHTTERFRKEPAAFESRAQCIPHLQQRTIERSGHMMHLDRPDVVAAIVEEFAHAAV
jgi:pimeloyl-ACP methyl ester carboxylesterase